VTITEFLEFLLFRGLPTLSVASLCLDLNMDMIGMSPATGLTHQAPYIRRSLGPKAKEPATLKLYRPGVPSLYIEHARMPSKELHTLSNYMTLKVCLGGLTLALRTDGAIFGEAHTHPHHSAYLKTNQRLTCVASADKTKVIPPIIKYTAVNLSISFLRVSHYRHRGDFGDYPG